MPNDSPIRDIFQQAKTEERKLKHLLCSNEIASLVDKIAYADVLMEIRTQLRNGFNKELHNVAVGLLADLLKTFETTNDSDGHGCSNTFSEIGNFLSINNDASADQTNIENTPSTSNAFDEHNGTQSQDEIEINQQFESRYNETQPSTSNIYQPYFVLTGPLPPKIESETRQKSAYEEYNAENASQTTIDSCNEACTNSHASKLQPYHESKQKYGQENESELHFVDENICETVGPTLSNFSQTSKSEIEISKNPEMVSKCDVSN